jgi:predicted glycosyltransferase
VSSQTFCDDMMSLIGAADVAVTMGGYNTVCELLASGRRAVIVPRTEPGHEQLLRAERMAGHGLLRMVHPARLAPGSLRAALQAELAALHAGTPVGRLRRQDGLAQVSRELLELMQVSPARAVAPAAARAAQGAGARHYAARSVQA